MTNTQEPRTPTVAAQIEALAAKATARPWNHLGYCGQDAVIQGQRQVPIGTMIAGKSSGETGHQCYHNAALAVFLVNNLPAIVTALRQAEAAPGVSSGPMCESDPMYETATEAAFAVGKAAYEKRGVTPELRRVVRMALESEVAPTPPSVDAAMVEEASAKAEARFAEHSPVMSEIINRAISLYRFDTPTDKSRAHEVARIVACNVALASRQPAGVSEAEMRAFGACDAACYFYPGEDQQAERSAFCAGAAHSVSAAPATDAGEA